MLFVSVFFFYGVSIFDNVLTFVSPPWYCSGFVIKVRICGMCCVAASRTMSLNWLIVVSGCTCSSMCDVKLCQSAFLKFHLGKVDRGVVCWPMVMWIGRWSLK